MNVLSMECFPWERESLDYKGLDTFSFLTYTPTCYNYKISDFIPPLMRLINRPQAIYTSFR